MPHTLTGVVRHETDIRKSRFLALAAPIDSSEAAQTFLEASRDLQATHNCWAWRLGEQYRFQDDGEPGGTAGRPILQAIDAQGYDRVAVLVIRWFGGIKLGTGGLVRAYGGTAAECLRLADRVELREECHVLCACPYADMDRVQARLLAVGARIEHAEYDGQGVVWRLRCLRDEVVDLETLYTDQTRGQGCWRVMDAGGGAGEQVGRE